MPYRRRLGASCPAMSGHPDCSLSECPPDAVRRVDAKWSVSEVRTRILQAASFQAACFKGWLRANRSRMRATSALRSLRVNFHSNGRAMLSKWRSKLPAYANSG